MRNSVDGLDNNEINITMIKIHIARIKYNVFCFILELNIYNL